MLDHLPERLRAARTSAGVPREAAALRTHKTAATIAAYERGTICPPLPVLMQLAQLYGVRIEDLVDQEVDVAA